MDIKYGNFYLTRHKAIYYLPHHLIDYYSEQYDFKIPYQMPFVDGIIIDQDSLLYNYCHIPLFHYIKDPSFIIFKLKGTIYQLQKSICTSAFTQPHKVFNHQYREFLKSPNYIINFFFNHQGFNYQSMSYEQNHHSNSYLEWIETLIQQYDYSQQLEHILFQETRNPSSYLSLLPYELIIHLHTYLGINHKSEYYPLYLYHKQIGHSSHSCSLI